MHIRLYRDVVAIPQHPGNRVQVPVVDAMELTSIRDVERLMVEEELLSELKRLRDVSMKLTKDDERLEIDSVDFCVSTGIIPDFVFDLEESGMPEFEV